MLYLIPPFINRYLGHVIPNTTFHKQVFRTKLTCPLEQQSLRTLKSIRCHQTPSPHCPQSASLPRPILLPPQSGTIRREFGNFSRMAQLFQKLPSSTKIPRCNALGARFFFCLADHISRMVRSCSLLVVIKLLAKIKLKLYLLIYI